MAQSKPDPPEAPPVVRRPFGRCLDDFPDLSSAETMLLASCRKGEEAIVDETLPVELTPGNGVRAGLVRFLALGGDKGAPVHERGVRLRGAWLTGPLDLEAAEAVCPLILRDCMISRLGADQAKIPLLSLSGCRVVDGVAGDQLCSPGGVFLRNGFHSTGPVRLVGATLGALDCSGSHFENAGGTALSFDRSIVSGSVFMSKTFRADGCVSLLGARIGGNLDCGDGRFLNKGGVALCCDGAIISDSVRFSDAFQAVGEVRLIGARIGGDLDCDKLRIDNPGRVALACQRAEVGGGFFFQSLGPVAGCIDLSAMHAGSLCDEAASWEGVRGKLILDGFTYERLAGEATTDPTSRTNWLDRQIPAHLGTEFRPQPWEQLITVLRGMGHPNAARAIAVAKQDRMRRAGRMRGGARALHWLYGTLVGYGYLPFRLLRTIAAVWLLCALAYSWSANPCWFDSRNYLIAPAGREVGPGGLAVRGPSGLAGPCPPRDAAYETFVPLIYSADVLLPVVDLGYKEEWQPVVSKGGKPFRAGQLLRFLYWFEIAFGWVAGLLLVGVLGNLVKKD